MTATCGLAVSFRAVVCIAPLLLGACGTWPWQQRAADAGEAREGRAAIAAHDEPNDDEHAPSGSGDRGGKDGHGGAADLFAYANRLRTLDEAGLEAEYRQVDERFARSPDPGDRLRLAILLMEPEAPFADLDKARALLNDYLNDPASYVEEFAYRDVALFLLRYSWSIQQAGVSESDISRQLDAERTRRETLSRRVESLQAELARVRTERMRLQEQVEALKNIEDTLRAREQAGEEQLKR